VNPEFSPLLGGRSIDLPPGRGGQVLLFDFAGFRAASCPKKRPLEVASMVNAFIFFYFFAIFLYVFISDMSRREKIDAHIAENPLKKMLVVLIPVAIYKKIRLNESKEKK
jgi:hypothetical protein